MDEKKMKFRLSPTPSGYLHQGNALNFVLNWWQAKIYGADLLLRIDDHDVTRKRPEFVSDIFDVLDWLGLDWNEGPKESDDFERNYSQNLKKEDYRDFANKVPDTFWCQCSRNDLKSYNGSYPGICRNLNLDGDGLALRVNTDSFDGVSFDLKDCVIWRKDDLPAYQLVSLYEDLNSKVTHVLRGEDLKESSQFQKELAKAMGLELNTSFFHHPLIKFKDQKLSKSQNASPVMSEFPDSKSFYSEFVGPVLREWWSLDYPISSAQDLLDFKLKLFK